MTIDQALKALLKDWENLPKEFRDKYRSYRSKVINQSDFVGIGKKIEMLEQAGFKIEVSKPHK